MEKEISNAEKAQQVMEILEQMEKAGEFDELSHDEKEIQHQIIGMRLRREL